MTSHEHILAQEREFYDTVMLGSAVMRPGSGSRIDLHAVEAPGVINELRKSTFSGLDTDAPIDYLQLRYNTHQERFCIQAMSLSIKQGASLHLKRVREGYGVSITQQRTNPIEPRVSLLSNHAAAPAFGELGMPLRPPTDDPTEYLRWLHATTEHANSWRATDNKVVRRAKVGDITAKLTVVRESEKFPDGNLIERGGMEYSITDATPPSDRAEPPVRVTSVAYVGETKGLDGTDFSSYMQQELYYPKTRQRNARREHQEVLLTPRNQEVWLGRLVDETTGVPYAAPTLE